MKDLRSELNVLYQRAYLSDSPNRVEIMDKISLALFYNHASYVNLAWGIANELGVYNEKAADL
jgi:hypothetical protein